MRECRIIAWTSFGFAPASMAQVALDVRRLRQFTNPRPSFRLVGFMKRVRMLLSRIGLPSRTLWKTRSSGPSDFTSLYFRTASPAFTSTVSSLRRWISSLTERSTPIVPRTGHGRGRTPKSSWDDDPAHAVAGVPLYGLALSQ